MRSQINLLFIAMLTLMLTACDKPATTSALVLEGKTMGTVWRVSLADVASERRAELQQRIQQQLDADDAELSTWKPDSALSRFNQSRDLSPQPVSENMADIVTTSLRIGRKTGGAMDITVGPLVNLWGFGPTKQPGHTPDAAQIAAARAQTGLQHLRVLQGADGQWLQKDLPGLYVDLSTVGEGFATDHLARLMEQLGINNYLVSVGGAVLSRGLNAQQQPWRGGVQKPTHREKAGPARGNPPGPGPRTPRPPRQPFEPDGKRISHVIDPVTGRPIEHKLVSATVIATTALEADGWDTGLMVLGTEKAQALAIEQHLAVYLISKQGDKFVSWMSPQFAAFLIPAESGEP